MWVVESDTESLLREFFKSSLTEVPPPVLKFGATEVRWWEGRPGDAIIMASGGSISDRWLGEQIVKAQLEAIGYRRASFTFDHFSGLTGPQRERAVAEQDEVAPDRSQIVHQFPNGWTVRKLQTYADKAREGALMSNCWANPVSPDDLKAPEDYQEDLPPANSMYNTRHYSLRDEYNYPHVSFHMHEFDGPPGARQAVNFFGHGNAAVSPDYQGMLKEWAKQNNVIINSTDFRGWREAHIKTAGWPDIMAKAKRLIQGGNVTILRNGYNNVVGHVVGDHGEYNTEIGRDDPNSRTITTWTCECPWDQYAWQRTRKWKKYEGRPCAHVMATYWKALATPLDEGDPNQPIDPGQKGGPPPTPNAAPIPNTDQRSFGPDEAEGTSAPPTLPPEGAPPMAPPGEPGVLPPSPMEQLQMQQPPIPGATPAGMPANPAIVSVPGAKMPSPFNPIQYPGGTYSAVEPVQIVQTTTPEDSMGDAGNFDGSLRQPFIYHHPTRTLYLGNPGMHHDEVSWTNEFAPVQQDYESTFPEQHPDYFQGEINHTPYGKALGYGGFDRAPNIEGVHEALSTIYPDLEAPKVPAKFLEGEKWGTKIAQEEFVAPEIVRLKKDAYGLAEGKSEAHGAGQYQNVPANSTGEVMGQDPTTGWIEVIFPLEGGPMTPYHVRCFVNPSDLMHTEQQPPGPFIKRKR